MGIKHYKKFIIVRLALILLFAVIGVGSFFSSFVSVKTYGLAAVAEPTPKTKGKIPVKPLNPPQASKYANFQHPTHLALKLDCNSCHKVPTANWDKVRAKDAAFPDVTDYPKHDSCVNCHREQFFKGNPPAICANCHLKPSPNDSTRFPFPNPREIFDASTKGKTAESSFQIFFPHDKHIEIVSQIENTLMMRENRVMFLKAGMKRAEESCKVCHQTYQPQGDIAGEFATQPPKDLGDGFWLKKGTFKTTPIGHTTCFTCHSTETGIKPAPDDCATCHKVKEKMPSADFDANLAKTMNITDKIALQSWRKRDSSGKFRHEWMPHADLACATCHSVSEINTTIAKTKKVAVTSCDNCHITTNLRDGGILNTEIDARKKDVKFECVKCHIAFGKEAIPASHLKAAGVKEN